MFQLLRTASHLLAPLTANCADFRDHWNQAGASSPEGVEGRWEGDWVSAQSGRRGPLKCLIEVTNERRWHGRFRAGYAKVLRACYASDFHVARLDGDRWTFSGRSDLGALAGGPYEYSGEATLEAFTCRYTSAYDHGEFRLHRA